MNVWSSATLTTVDRIRYRSHLRVDGVSFTPSRRRVTKRTLRHAALEEDRGWMLHEPSVVRHAHQSKILEVREGQSRRLLREEAAEAEDRRLRHGGAARGEAHACESCGAPRERCASCAIACALQSMLCSRCTDSGSLQRASAQVVKLVSDESSAETSKLAEGSL